MDDNRIQVLEQQLDVLAGRTAVLEESLGRLRRALSAPEVLQRLGLLPEQMEDVFMPHVVKARGESQHRAARIDLVDHAKRDALLRRVERASDYADRTGTPFGEAWEVTPPNSVRAELGKA